MVKILMHMPYPLPLERISGSQVRPGHMYKAFGELGCEVTAVTGNVTTRWGHPSYESSPSGRLILIQHWANQGVDRAIITGHYRTSAKGEWS